MLSYRTVVGLAIWAPGLLSAQNAPRRDSVIELPPMTVTATRDLREVFTTPAPVSVVDSTQLALRAPANVTDLFLDLPGLDLNGIGPSQTRPVIRGQLGQRILLLEDGLRMNNSRRQQEFGEIASIVALEALGRVEVVRGPASVLYGTDAIGGAVNLITRQPRQSVAGTSVRGSVGYRYQSAGEQQRPWGLATGTAGHFNWLAFGSYRDAGAYDAPAGSFGGLTLRTDTKVRDSGVRDANVMLQAGYAFSETQSVFARYERYSAKDAGFGYVANGDMQPVDPNAPTIKITYPTQYVDKVSAGYSSRRLGFALADRLDVTGYYMTNNRTLDLDVFIPFGPGTPPGAGLIAQTNNYTSLATWGTRIEAAKAVAGKHLLTYGFDGFRDRSNNLDRQIQTVVGFGPPSTTTSSVPQVPNAIFRSLGAFAQFDMHPTARLNLIAGARLQDIRAETRRTPGISAANVSDGRQTAVGTLNLGYTLTDNLTLIGSVGRGFRAPNLVERFFTGPTPEGSGYQVQTPGLRPETSVNVDVGLRFRSRRGSLEVFGFRNEIHNGIAIQPTGDTVQGLPAYENVNVDKLRYLGLEFSGNLILGAGFSTAANLTVFDSKDVQDPSNPVGQTYGTRVGGTVRYDHPSHRFWVASDVRHNGEQKDISISSAVGSPVPGFTVFDARAGARLFRAGSSSHSVSVTVANLANTLYSEASNTSFFRPAPGRNVVLSYRVDF
jgi:outer membrane receptor protein involved in Fe transport